MRVYPPTGFARLMYLLCIACSNTYCFSDWGMLTEEIYDCVKYLYWGALWFLLMGIYLFEVVP
jgi:hypothetical protein